MDRAPAAIPVEACTGWAVVFQLPQPLFTPEAEFSDEARRAKYQGEVMISLIVDAQGNPQNPHVVRPLGMGLDEKALEAVRQVQIQAGAQGWAHTGSGSGDDCGEFPPLLDKSDANKNPRPLKRAGDFRL